jgi:hypothetical protein
MAENDRELFSLSQETLEVPLYEPASNWASAVSPNGLFVPNAGLVFR